MSIIDKVKSIKDRRAPKALTVKSATNLTPNMRRVTLQGEALAGFPEHAEGAYIKLLFKQMGNHKPVMRTYTVAEQRSDQREIDVDFMLHSGNDGTASGIAAPWSVAAKPGDEMSIAGPGAAKFINTDAEYFLLAADMTALPALTVNLKRLPEDAQGQVFIEILSEADKQDLAKPNQIAINWVINNDPGSDKTPLFYAIAQAELPANRLAAWVACEFKTMKKIRQHLKDDRGIEKSHLYISSYWKKGDSEEMHKVAKQQDQEKSGV